MSAPAAPPSPQSKGHHLPGYVQAIRRVDWIAMAVALATLAIYLRTLAPSVLWADEGEFQYSAYALYVPHTTGYPLYIFIAKLWTLLPVGDVAYRVNLMSAFWGIVTVVLTYVCVRRLGVQRPVAAASALSLAFSSVFWKQSSIAGVRTMHTAFVALITLLAIGVTQRKVSVKALALAVGLSLTHHRMTLLLLPGLTWVLWQARAQVAWSVRRAIKCVALVALPQLLYLFVAFGRSWSSPGEFWNFVLGTTVESGLLSKPLKIIATQFTEQALPSVGETFTAVGLLITLLGLGALILASRRDALRRSIGVYLAVGWVVNIVFAGVHLTEDANKYLAHGFTLQAIALGVGLGVIADWLNRKIRPHCIGRHVGWAAMALPLVLIATGWSRADQSGTGWIGPFTLEELVSVESNSIVVADWAFFPAYRYHQVVEGHRRDLKLVFDLDHVEMSRVEPKIKQGRPVYLRERRLGKRWKDQLPFIPVERLWRVLPAEPEFGAPRQVNRAFGDEIRLTQVATWPAKPTADQMMLLRFGWELAGPIEHEMSVSVRLVDGDGTPWRHQEMSLQDATGLLSTTAWALGPAFPPGEYHWQISVDDQSIGANVGLGDLPSFRVERPDHTVPLSSLVLEGRPATQPGIDGWELAGYASPVREAQPGGFVTASLFWRAGQDASDPAEARLELRDEQGRVIAEQSVTLPRVAHAGDLVETRPGIELPVQLADGRYEFFITGTTPASLGRLDVKGRTRNYSVPPIAHRRQVQLGESIELVGYEVSTDNQQGQAQPGGQVRLKLIWLAKNTVGQSYKVFVHVVGADGNLLVQQDGVPGNWALPTDTWAAGEVIADSYEIPVPPEAPPGNYVIQIGMYNPENEQRLSAHEGGSRLADDSILLAQLTIP